MARPPPKTFTPPMRLPSIGSEPVPNERLLTGAGLKLAWVRPLIFGLLPYATSVSTGLLCCRPYRLPPGCTAENKFAVDKARPDGKALPAGVAPCPRLKSFAVFAFCAEITRLPNHCDVNWLPENATAQTVPSRSTMVRHMLKPRPPF